MSAAARAANQGWKDVSAVIAVTVAAIIVTTVMTVVMAAIAVAVTPAIIIVVVMMAVATSGQQHRGNQRETCKAGDHDIGP